MKAYHVRRQITQIGSRICEVSLMSFDWPTSRCRGTPAPLLRLFAVICAGSGAAALTVDPSMAAQISAPGLAGA
jgi:hypothetical protein